MLESNVKYKIQMSLTDELNSFFFNISKLLFCDCVSFFRFTGESDLTHGYKSIYRFLFLKYFFIDYIFVYIFSEKFAS